MENDLEPQLPTQNQNADFNQRPVLTPGSQDNTHKSKRLPLVLILVAALLVLGIAAYFISRQQAASNGKQLNVGLMMAFTGGSSQMGFGASRGVELAKKHLGASNINVIHADSKCDPSEVPNAMNFLRQQNVVAIIGEGCSSASLAAVPIANDFRIPLVSPSSSSPALSIPDDYFFRVIASDELQGRFLAQTMYDKGLRRAAVFYTNEPYGSGISQVFRDHFESLGGEITAAATADPDVIALEDQFQTIKDSNPDAVFMAPNSMTSGIAAIRIARQNDITVPLYGADVFYDNTIIQNAPDAVEGLIVSTFPTGSPGFKAEIEQEFQTTEQLYAASQAYDAFTAIYNAIQQGAHTGEEIKTALPKTAFDGVSARIEFDQNGEISYLDYQYDLFQIRNGQFVILE